VSRRHAVSGRGPRSAGFPDFGLFFDLGLVAGSEPDDFAEELLVDLAENVRYRLTASG
jgi:hypothetical protein